MITEAERVALLLQGYRIRFEYYSFDADLVIPATRHEDTVPEDSYLTNEPALEALREALDKGFRWVRTDGDVAVFERMFLSPPPEKRD